MFINGPCNRKTRNLINENTFVFEGPYTLDSFIGEGTITLHVGDTVQLLDRSLLTIEHFEQHIQIIDDDRQNLGITIYATGRKYHHFKTCTDLNGFLKTDPYEVYRGSRNRENVNGIRRKVKLIKTNASYPLFKSQGQATFISRYCRKEDTIRRLSPDQADPGRTRIDPTRQRNMFIHHRSNPPQRAIKRYSFGDAFCGVGGCSAGARIAGLEIKWAFDADENVCHIYSENFPRAKTWVARVDQFLALKELGKVDVLHISPPCQTWSLAHTVAGTNDDANSASLFCIKDLLLMFRPRIVTLEQVCGLIRKNENKLLLR